MDAATNVATAVTAATAAVDDATGASGVATTASEAVAAVGGVAMAVVVAGVAEAVVCPSDKQIDDEADGGGANTVCVTTCALAKGRGSAVATVEVVGMVTPDEPLASASFFAFAAAVAAAASAAIAVAVLLEE